jgi:hypothetical protein
MLDTPEKNVFNPHDELLQKSALAKLHKVYELDKLNINSHANT